MLHYGQVMRYISSPVDVVQLVHRVDRQNHLCQVKFSHVFRQAVLELAQQSQQITANVVVHHQILQREKEKDRKETLEMHKTVREI